MIRTFLYYLAWEWINISLEYTAISWLRLPKRFLAVVYVNLLTHPLFVVCFPNAGQNFGQLAVCECAIFAVEAIVLTLFFGRVHWRQAVLASLTMNATSCLTGVLLML